MKLSTFYISHFVVMLSTVAIGTNGYKILGIFPIPGKSHFTYNNAIMKSLIEAGHDVTVITPFPEQASVENYTSIIDTSKDEFIYVGQSSFTEFSQMNAYELLTLRIGLEKSYCYKFIKLPEIQKILNSNEKSYDVIFVEIFHIYKCYFPIAEKMNIPVIGTDPFKVTQYSDYAIGNPNNPALIPFELFGSLKWRHFYDRLYNTYNAMVSRWFWYFRTLPLLNQFHEDNIQYLDSLSEYKNIEPALIFYNNHASFLPRPTNPNAIEIGGIHVKEAKLLPEHIQKFIDEAEHGVILFSFGSVVRAANLTKKIQEAFKETFAEIPQRVIWKFEENMENVPSNVMLMSWLPQQDILEHKNVRAFISHCGQGGTYEAIYSATPVISCPLFADQHGIAALLEDLEVAVHLDINNISKRNVHQALNLIFNDTRYQTNMQQLSNTFKDRPMTPQQSVVYWTEYVIRHKGASHLQTASIHMNWFQYLLLDVVCLVTVFASCIAFFIYKFIKTLNIIFIEMTYKFGKNYKNKSIK